MKVTLRMFASARDAFGFDTRALTIDEPNIEAIRRILLQERPNAGALLRTCRFAVNMEYAGTDLVLSDGDEVAVIPPVSGG